jgi:hypothetical protein
MSDGMHLVVVDTSSLLIECRRSRGTWRPRRLGCCAISSSHRSGHMSHIVIKRRQEVRLKRRDIHDDYTAPHAP